MHVNCAMETVLVAFILMATGSWCVTGEIAFIQEPMNVTVSEGMDSYFPCSYNGTNRSPAWKINNHTYFINNLPFKTSYNGSVLTVSDVDLSLNDTSYFCYITVLISGTFKKIESDTGFLFVSANKSSSSLYPTLSPSAVCTAPTTHYSTEESTIHVQPTVTTSPTSEVQSSNNLIIGITVPVGLLAVVVVVVVVVVVIKTWRKMQRTCTMCQSTEKEPEERLIKQDKAAFRIEGEQSANTSQLQKEKNYHQRKTTPQGKHQSLYPDLQNLQNSDNRK